MKVAAYVIVSVDNGPWVTVPLAFDTGQPIMRFVFGEQDGIAGPDADDIPDYETADPELRAHVERMYGAIADYSWHQALRISGA